MRKFVASAVLCSSSLALLTGCTTAPTVVYVPQASHTGRDVGITVAVVGAGVGITLLAVHEHHFVKGCTTVGPAGLMLETGDAQKFNLVGSTAAVREGELVRVKGKKGKKDAAGNRSFLVDSVSKDYGMCKIPAKS